MPWLTQWIDPDVFTEHRGVTVYHTYVDVEATSGPARFVFTTSTNDSDPQFQFDVRSLTVKSAARLYSLPADCALATERAVIRDVIHQAIDFGVLALNEERPRARFAAEE